MVTWDVFVIGGHAAVPSPRVHCLTISQPAVLEGQRERVEARAAEVEDTARSIPDVQYLYVKDVRFEPPQPRSRGAGEVPRGRSLGRPAGGVGSGNKNRSRSQSLETMRALKGRGQTVQSGEKMKELNGGAAAQAEWEVGAWEERASLGTARTHHCCAVADGVVLAIGGTGVCSTYPCGYRMVCYVSISCCVGGRGIHYISTRRCCCVGQVIQV